MSDIFDATLHGDVFYPLSISLEAFEILQGVRNLRYDFLMVTYVNAGNGNG